MHHMFNDILRCGDGHKLIYMSDIVLNDDAKHFPMAERVLNGDVKH